MQTTAPDRHASGLTDKQLECLQILMDGDWHDYKEIGQKIRIYIPANISGRIIRPLEEQYIVEEEDRPVKEGSRKTKKCVRIRKDIDEYRLHQVIIQSANQIVNKYNEKLADLYAGTSGGRDKSRTVEEKKKKAENYNKQYSSFLAIRDKSLKKCSDIEKLAEEQQQEYWKARESVIPYSESWPQLVAIEKQIAEALEEQQKGRTEIEWEKTCGRAALLARSVNPELWNKVKQESHEYEEAQAATYPPAGLQQ